MVYPTICPLSRKKPAAHPLAPNLLPHITLRTIIDLSGISHASVGIMSYIVDGRWWLGAKPMATNPTNPHVRMVTEDGPVEVSENLVAKLWDILQPPASDSDDTE